MPTDRFFYAGFIPKGSKKRKFFRELISINASLVFFETANRLTDSLTYALEILGDREANTSSPDSERFIYYVENPLKILRMKMLYRFHGIKLNNEIFDFVSF